MKKFKFENIEFNLTEEVFDYSLLVSDNFLHEPDTYKYALSVLENFDDNDVFIDVGGCFGIFSLLINKGTAFCFEPSVENWAICKRNFELNPGKNIVLFNIALADIILKYYVKRETQLNMTALPGQTKTIYSEGDTYTTTLDIRLLPLLKPNQKVKLIKTDTEGHDREILAGARKIIETFHPIIITETEVPNWLSAIGYSHVAQLDELNKIWKYGDKKTELKNNE